MVVDIELAFWIFSFFAAANLSIFLQKNFLTFVTWFSHRKYICWRSIERTNSHYFSRLTDLHMYVPTYIHTYLHIICMYCIFSKINLHRSQSNDFWSYSYIQRNRFMCTYIHTHMDICCIFSKINPGANSTNFEFTATYNATVTVG
jgi:hypothetical protein